MYIFKSIFAYIPDQQFFVGHDAALLVDVDSAWFHCVSFHFIEALCGFIWLTTPAAYLVV